MNMLPTTRYRRPNNKTISRVIAYLNTLGIDLYGQCIDLDTGETFTGLMDYNEEDVFKLMKLVQKNAFWSKEQAR